jgi:hypothetical protein
VTADDAPLSTNWHKKQSSLGEEIDAGPDAIREFDTELATLDQAVFSRRIQEFDLNPLHPLAGDRVFGWITTLSRASRLASTLGAAILGALPLLIAWLEGNFFNEDLALSAARDFGYWCQQIIAIPLLIVTGSLYFGDLHRAILRLCINNVFEISRTEHNSLVLRANKIYNNFFIRVTPWAIGILAPIVVSFVYVFDFGRFNTWHSPDGEPFATVAGWTSLPYGFVLYYLISNLVLRIGATFFVLREFFRFKANVQPFHPDGCGGLGPLGQLSTKINLATFVFGLLVMGWVLVNVHHYNLPVYHLANVALATGYVCSAAIVFFLPLYAAHQAMKKAKYDTLFLIHDRFQRANRQVHHDLLSEKQPSDENLNKLDNIQRLYNIARKMPIFPFNLRIVSSFAGSVGIPIVLAILPKFMANVVVNLFAG